MRALIVVFGVFSGFAWSQTRCVRQANESNLSFQFRCQVVPVLDDVLVVVIKGPDYLAQRLPAMQAMEASGTQMDLARWGDFSVTVGVASGFYTSFKDEVADGFVKIPKDSVPDLLPLPVGVIGVRFAANEDWELGARYAFVPGFEVKQKDYRIEATTQIFGAHARHRLLPGSGGRPTLVARGDFSYFTGAMKVGRDFELDIGTIQDSELNQELNDAVGVNVLGPNDSVGVGAFFNGAPILGWDIWQLSAELRATWGFGFFHPFLGGGLDLAWGHVDSGSDLALDARITSPAPLVDAAERVFGNAKIADVIERQSVTFKSVDPRPVGGRLLAGMEFDLGDHFRLPIEGQYDVGSTSFVAGLGLRYALR